MYARYFYLKWDNLLNNLTNAYKAVYPYDDLKEVLDLTVDDTLRLDYSENTKKYFFKPIPLEGYDWIELVQVPMDLTHYRYILELDNNVYANKHILSEEDIEALELIQDLTFGRWGAPLEVNIENVFKDYDYELLQYTSKIFANKTLSPNMVDTVLKKWEEHNFKEKMDVFGKENHMERRIMFLWIELLKAVKERENCGLVYNWY